MTGPAPEPTTQPGRSFETPLEGALWAQSKGLCVAPVTAGEKAPPLGHWKTLSTNNKAYILAFAEKYPGSNWLIDCGKSALGVLDEDVKGDKKGRDTTLMMQVEHGPWPATTVVRTPSGGRHWYFWGETKTTASVLGPDVDTRGVGGYVICPGSIVDGKQYVLIKENGINNLPEWINEELKKKREEAGMAVEQVPVVDQDLDTSIVTARNYLATTAPCVEGQGGDARLVSVAAKVKDIGVSEAVAVDLIIDIFSPRCRPPWDDDDIERKVANAYRYCRENQPGIASPEAMFPEDMSKHPQAVLVGAAVQQKSAQQQQQQAPQANPAGDADWDAPAAPPGSPEAAAIEAALLQKIPKTYTLEGYSVDPPKRQWLIPDWVPEKEAVLFAGNGGVGKSLMTMGNAISVATFTPFMGITPAKQAPVLFVSCEDNCDELHRRAHAYMKSKGMLGVKAPLEFMPITGTDVTPLLCIPGPNNVMLKGPFYDILCLKLSMMPPGVFLILDTLSDVWAGDENARAHVNQFVKRCLRSLITKYGCTIMAIGHTSKAEDSEYSGSTGWNNSFRARLFLNISKDKIHREYSRPKSNYAVAGESIIAEWSEGTFRECAAAFDDSAENAAMSHVFDAICNAAAQGAPLSLTAQSARYIGKLKVNGADGRPIEKLVKELAANELINLGRVEFRKGERFGNGLYPQAEW